LRKFCLHNDQFGVKKVIFGCFNIFAADGYNYDKKWFELFSCNMTVKATSLDCHYEWLQIETILLLIQLSK